MAETINAKSGNDGRIVVQVYEQTIDVTNRIRNGETNLNIYGKNYKVRVQAGKDINGVSKARRFKKARK